MSNFFLWWIVNHWRCCYFTSFSSSYLISCWGLNRQAAVNQEYNAHMSKLTSKMIGQQIHRLLEMYFFWWVQLLLFTLKFVQWTQSFLSFWKPETKTETSNKAKDDPFCGFQLFFAGKIDGTVLSRLITYYQHFQDWMKSLSPNCIVRDERTPN